MKKFTKSELWVIFEFFDKTNYLINYSFFFSVTQYLNPFPVFPSANSPKHVVNNVVMTASAMPAQHNGNCNENNKQINQTNCEANYYTFEGPTTQHLLSSSSNVAQTVMPQTIMKSYLGGKPAFISASKPTEFTNLKFFSGINGMNAIGMNGLNGLNGYNGLNGFAPSSKIPPVFISSASSSMPSLQIFSTTSRVPILR